MTELAVPVARVPIRPPVGLLLSIGELRTNAKGTEYPAKLDHFRAKPGKLGQHEAEVSAFQEHYGDDPKSIDDMKFISNDVPACLDIRLLAFSKTGFRGRGLTNYADQPFLSREDFSARTWSYEDTFLYYPRDSKEVRPELRESWEGEPIEGILEGKEDPRVAKLGIKIVATLEFQLPEIMGVGRCARISTSSKRSISNLYSGLWLQWWAWGQQLMGIPFRLAVRPCSGQRFVKNEMVEGERFTGFLPNNGFELLIDTPLTEGEIFRRINERRLQLGPPSAEDIKRESQLLTKALALPVGSESPQTRDEPEPDRPSDALLNRIAAMTEEAGDGALMMLRGVFGVDSAEELGSEDAERYEGMLLAALPAEEVEGEIVQGSGSDDTHRAVASRDEGSPSASASGSAAVDPESSGESKNQATLEPEPPPLDDAPGGAASPVAPPGAEYEEEPEPTVGDEATDFGATVIPGNLRVSGRTLQAVYEETKDTPRGGWVGWALRRNPDLWPGDFRWALATFALERGIEP